MKEKSIVLNMMTGQAGEILERGRNYMVKRTEAGAVYAYCSNTSQEETVLKLTLTALEPFALFDVVSGKNSPVRLRANAAGIFENRFVISPGTKLEITETCFSADKKH